MVPAMESKKKATKAEAVEMLERLRKGTDHFTEFTWPATEQRFAMVVLGCGPIQQAQAAATRRWETLGLKLDLYTTDDFHSEVNTQCLALAIRVLGEDGKPAGRAFPDVDQLRDLITPDERSLLISIYVENQQETNPDMEDLSPELIAMMEQCVKKKDLIPLTAFGSWTLATYLLGMESRQSS